MNARGGHSPMRRIAMTDTSRMAAVALALACSLAWPRAHAAPPATTRAEIQIGLCAPPADVERSLGLRPRDAPYDVWQFDDAALTLLAKGLRLRLRMHPGRPELTLKIADQNCEALAPGSVPPREGKCEYDVYAGQRAGAVSLNNALDADATRELIAGRLPVARALSAAQARYLRDVVHFWPLPPDLVSLGPIKALTYRTSDKTYDVDVNVLPGGERYVEITRKVPLADADRAFKTMQEYLAVAGIAECADHSGQAANKLRALLPRR